MPGSEAPLADEATALAEPSAAPEAIADSAPVAAAEPVPAVEPIAEPLAEAFVAPFAAPVPVTAPVAAAVAAPVAAPVAAKVEPFVLPAGQLAEVAQSAGLQWVNSDADKIRAVQEAMANEPKPMHVPRERKPVVVADEGPLVLVETRKDLSQITLPFDQAAQEPRAPQ